MYCKNCGKQLIGTPEICPNCGAKPLAGNSFCQNCGAAITPLTEICVKCGARVAIAKVPEVPMAEVKPKSERTAVAALVLGIVSLFAWFIPLIGFPVSVSGIIVSILAIRRKQNKSMYLVGIIGSSIGLVLTIINAILGALLTIGLGR